MSFELDPQVAAVLAAIAETSGPMPAPAPVGDVDNRRVALNAMLEYANNTAQPVADTVDITDHEVTTGDGTAIRARWYRSPASVSRAAVLYLHGGGMIVGSVPIFDGPVSRYVASTGVPMLSVDYRLAPEHPHPTPVEDAYTGLLWLAAHADELGVDADRIAVMGDSAGGGIAAAVAILSRDRRGPAIARQILLYPMLDDRTTTPDPYIAPFAAWSYDDNVTGWTALLGDRAGGPDVEASAAPARLTDATGLPPAYIEVGQARHLPQRNHQVRAHPEPSRRTRRTARAPRRSPRIRRHRLRRGRPPPRPRRPPSPAEKPVTQLRNTPRPML